MARSGPGPVLITGATGQVGGELARSFARLKTFDGEVHTPSRGELDLTSVESIRAYVRSVKPRWIINPAAYTAVDKAESEPELAHAVNAEAPRVLGEEAAKIGAGVLHFSTDYVFSGASTRPYREDDATGPVSVYGESKLAGELALAAVCPAHLILRTSWVYSRTGKNFLLTIQRLARERAESGQPLKIVNDQYGAPTSARELARLAIHLIAACETRTLFYHSLTQSVSVNSGIYHATGAGETSWFGFAREILRLERQAHSESPLATLLPIPSSEFPTPARRPANSRLDCRKLARVFELRMLPWKQELATVIAGMEPAATRTEQIRLAPVSS